MRRIISSLMQPAATMGMLLLNAGWLAHISPDAGTTPLTGDAMGDRDSLLHEPGYGLLIEDTLIQSVAPFEELMDEHAPSAKLSGGTSPTSLGQHSGHDVFDLAGRAVVPGLVDAHTHLLWAGDRSHEASLRRQGYSYHQIAEMGGGIAFTVRCTRDATQDELVSEGERRLRLAMDHGTTFIEAKSGYGLDTKSELALLEAADTLAKSTASPPMRHTWLGAHATPPSEEGDGRTEESRRAAYVDEMLAEQLPAVLAQGIADSVDVFCEPGWFTVEETEEICRAGAGGGLQVRLHVDEFEEGGGAALAAELRARTADHAAWSDSEGRASCARVGTLQGFLPGTPHVLGSDHWPPIRECLDNRWPWTLASDFNPNCDSLSLPFSAHLAVTHCGVDSLEALVACTRNAASGMDHPRGLQTGTLRSAAAASLNILPGDQVDGWIQNSGESPFIATLVEGRWHRSL